MRAAPAAPAPTPAGIRRRSILSGPTSPARREPPAGAGAPPATNGPRVQSIRAPVNTPPPAARADPGTADRSPAMPGSTADQVQTDYETNRGRANPRYRN